MPETEFELPEEGSLLLRDVPSQHYFYLYDGRVLKNTNDLLQALKDMSDFVFYHHVNNERNDFANWIKDVYGDYGFAHKVQAARTRQELISCLERELIKERLEKANEETKEKIKVSKALVRVQRKQTIKKKIQKPVLKARQRPTVKKALPKPTVKPLPEKKIDLMQKTMVQNPALQHNVKPTAQIPTQIPITKANPELYKVKALEAQLSAKLDEVLKKEKEIQIQEQKIKEIETTLSKRLEQVKSGHVDDRFFTKEFIQGLAIGGLFVAVFSVIIVRFF